MFIIIDENDNVFVVIGFILRNNIVEIFIFKGVDSGFYVIRIRVIDRDFGVNVEFSCFIVVGNEENIFVIDFRLCDIYINVSMEFVFYIEWEFLVII